MSLPEKLKILIVDDSPSIRDVIARTVEKMGYHQISLAKDVPSAIEIVQSSIDKGQPLEFIISDLNMPGPSGLDFLKEVRTMAEHKETPFLLVTTESEKEVVLKAAMCGVSNYVVKPFNYDTFVRKFADAYKKHFPG